MCVCVCVCVCVCISLLPVIFLRERWKEREEECQDY